MELPNYIRSMALVAVVGSVAAPIACDVVIELVARHGTSSPI
jgi:hypothetical protein